MQKTYLQFILVPLVAALLFMCSCTKSCNKSHSAAEQSTITVDVGFAIESLDPRYTTSAAASRISKLIFASLFVLGDDVAPQPFLAESIEVLDEKNFKITLKKGLTFHDNSPLTAHDVVYTYTQLGSADVSSPHAEKMNYVQSIYAPDDRHVIFELKEAHAPFLTDLSGIGIVSQKSCLGRSQECRHELNGSGPFKLKDWDTAKESIHLIPFENWIEGTPTVELNFRVVRDENTRILELIGKKADLVDSEFSPANAFKLQSHDHLKLEQINGLGFTYLAMNVRGPRDNDDKESDQYRTRAALADRKVRTAIAHAINVDQIIEKLLLNTADRVSGLIPNSHWAKDPELKPPDFDPERAQQLLDQAGFERRGKNNMRFKLTISTTPNRLRQSIAQLYAEFLRKVGIDAALRVKDWSALYQDMKHGNFEIFSAVWVPVTDPDLYYFVHHSSNIPTDNKSGGNRHGYKNSEVDRLIEMGRVTMEPEKRKLIYQEIERILLHDLPYIPLWNEHRIVVYNKRIKGYTPSPTGSLLGLRHASIASAQQKGEH